MLARSVAEVNNLPAVWFLNVVLKEEEMLCEAFFITAKHDAFYDINPVPAGELEIVTEHGEEFVIDFPALNGAGKYSRNRLENGDIQFYTFNIIKGDNKNE